jgi:RimJ/RimL family protein N-acetyltransferase
VIRLSIETDRLRLRRLTETDVDALHAIYGDAATMQFIGASGRPTADLDGTRRVLDWLLAHEREHGFGLWAIDERDGEAMVGIAGLLLVEGSGPEIEAVYLIRRDRWRRGYATEALRAVLEHGHDDLGLRRIIAIAWPQHDRSLRVMERAGMLADGDVNAYGRPMRRYVSDVAR